MSADRPYDSARRRSESYSSGSPFADEHSPPPSAYPPQHGRPLLATAQPAAGSAWNGEATNQAFRQYDAARAQTYPVGGGAAAGRAGGVQMPMPQADESGEFGHTHGGSRSGSWDLLAGMRKFEHGYEQFDSRNASQAHLQFADGDQPKNKLARLYNYLLNVSIVTRWILFIIPVLGLLWIPGILGLTKYPDTTIWGVKLIYWSIWLSVMWLGWWGALAAFMVLPPVLRNTVGIVIVNARKYIEWFEVLHRYAAFAAWSIVIFVSYQPLINHTQDTSSSSSRQAVDVLSKLLFALAVCACVLFAEKLAIQFIAAKFHERSYADRIASQKFAVRVLVTLYQHSTDIPWRSDTLRDGAPDTKRKSTFNAQKVFKKALKGVRDVATTTTTALGTVASEIAGTSVLQPNSPQAMVKTALESANKSRLLARRLFYSFARPGAEHLQVEDIERFFRSREEADAAFAIFDKDMNGDVKRDEIEMACMELHREQLAIEHSMRDLDSAVGRLDNILMSLYFVIVILIFAVALEASLATLITSAGTLVLGLSWLIGGSLAEVLTSIIFLFIKHPYDVGDRVTIGEKTYTVKEMRLLSTIFLDSNSCQVQAPNTWMNTQLIHNIRRSPQMSETFEFDVSFGTTFEQIEKLRDVMIAFLKNERRDFQPIFDVYVVDIPGQTKMTLRADIKYKSNWQQGTLKAQRRNKWICALKTSMAKVKIFGPSGDPDAPSGPAKYTLVPYEEVLRKEQEAKAAGTSTPLGMHEMQIPTADWTFADPKSAIVDSSQDVFDEDDQLYMTGPRQTPSGTPRHRTRTMPPAMPAMPAPATMPMPTTTAHQVQHPQPQMEEIELETPRGQRTFTS
ncbi:Mechanosensitive ion channel-domain-containing protein [Trametes polyzona]|nr:Mechanosensitive ion channel-domain-containing protein [Trametes polyzona]